MRIETRDATIEDAHFIGARLRAADIAELEAGGVEDCAGIVLESFATSTRCRVATVDGEPVAILGVCKGDEQTGIVWMLGTDKIKQISRKFLRGSSSELSLLAEGYAQLVNFVHASNTLSIKWLRWLGFDVSSEPAEHHPDFRFFMRVF